MSGARIDYGALHILCLQHQRFDVCISQTLKVAVGSISSSLVASAFTAEMTAAEYEIER